VRFTQFIVVSHKPQVFAKAHCLVGVYTHGGASRLTTAYFPEAPEKENKQVEEDDRKQGA
jgi:chromosome segregation ATPase